MNVAVETLPNCLASLRVEVEPAKVSQARETLIKEFGQNVRVPGFRPGKAPRSVVEKKFAKQIREELEGKLLRESTREAIVEKKLRVLHISNVEDIQFGQDDKLSFTATVVTQPEFELPQYKGLAIEVPSAEVTDAEIDEAIENLREQGADFSDIEDRGAQMEDYIVVDYVGTLNGQPVHEAFPKAGKPLSHNEDFWIKMTDEAFFPGYCTQLVGAKAGEAREFDVEVPADFPVEGMPGTQIHYKVTLKGLKTRTLPELNDEFANEVLKGKTLAELREVAREELGRQKVSEQDASKRNQIMKHLLASVECELPEGLVRNQTQRILSEIVRENQARGVTDDVLKGSERELVGMASQNARDKLKGTFVLLRVAEQEKIQVSQEELLGRVAAVARRHQLTFEKALKEIEKNNGLDQINEDILTAKTLDFLISQASVTSAAEAK